MGWFRGRRFVERTLILCLRYFRTKHFPSSSEQVYGRRGRRNTLRPSVKISWNFLSCYLLQMCKPSPEPPYLRAVELSARRTEVRQRSWSLPYREERRKIFSDRTLCEGFEKLGLCHFGNSYSRIAHTNQYLILSFIAKTLVRNNSKKRTEFVEKFRGNFPHIPFSRWRIFPVSETSPCSVNFTALLSRFTTI